MSATQSTASCLLDLNDGFKIGINSFGAKSITNQAQDEISELIFPDHDAYLNDIQHTKMIKYIRTDGEEVADECVQINQKYSPQCTTRGRE